MPVAEKVMPRKKMSPAASAQHAEHKQRMIARLRRIEGQLRGIQGMIEQDAGCEPVAQQVAAARRALDKAFFEIIACALEAEVESAANPTAAKAAGIQVTRILAKYG